MRSYFHTVENKSVSLSVFQKHLFWAKYSSVDKVNLKYMNLIMKGIPPKNIQWLSTVLRIKKKCCLAINDLPGLVTSYLTAFRICTRPITTILLQPHTFSSSYLLFSAPWLSTKVCYTFCTLWKPYLYLPSWLVLLFFHFHHSGKSLRTWNGWNLPIWTGRAQFLPNTCQNWNCTFPRLNI